MLEKIINIIKTNVTKTVSPISIKKYHQQNFTSVLHINCDNAELSDKNVIDLIVIAFNNDYVIHHQNRLLKKYLRDNYHYTVIDNSSETHQQKKIFELCKQEKIGYVKAPYNPYSSLGYASASHGLALTWSYRQFIRPRSAYYIGFLDHDIFPIRPTTIIDILQKQHIYGHIQERDHKWYLWPGFCFYDLNFVSTKNLDFSPSYNDNLDTGGKNWFEIYSKMDRKTMSFPFHKYGNLRNGADPQSDWVEFIGDWMHTFNASNWKKIANCDQKDKLVHELLLKY